MSEISFLADRPAFVERLAKWLHGEWGRLTPGSTLDDRVAQLRTQMRRDSLPMTLVAHDGPELLGSASLTSHDLPGRRDLTPWLASVFVSEPHRREGVGARLVEAIESLAGEAGFETIYLFTFDRQGYYGKRGWDTLDHGECVGEPVVIMRKSLRDGV